jgi:hypothetical protein
LSLLIDLIVGSLVGSLGYSKTAARYDAITTVRVMMNQVVENELLNLEQVKQLSVRAGQSSKKDYQSVASKFNFSEKQRSNALEGSNCSQFIVGINEAK